MPVFNESIPFVDDESTQFAIWPALDGFCEVTIATTDYPEGLPTLTELRTTSSDLAQVLEGAPLEITNGSGTCWLEQDGELIKVTYSLPDGSLASGNVTASDYRRLYNTIARVATP